MYALRSTNELRISDKVTEHTSAPKIPSESSAVKLLGQPFLA